jgi:hypothetical protein
VTENADAAGIPEAPSPQKLSAEERKVAAEHDRAIEAQEKQQRDEAKLAESEPELNREQWKERARVTFDASPHAVAGALHGLDADETLTEAEVRKRLTEFDRRPGVAEEDDES